MARASHSPDQLLELVLEGLDRAGEEQRLARVAVEAGVPLNTVYRLHQRRIPNPGVHNLQLLYRALYSSA